MAQKSKWVFLSTVLHFQGSVSAALLLGNVSSIFVEQSTKST